MDRPQTPPGMVAPPLRAPRTCSQCGNNGHNARTCTEPCAAASTTTTTATVSASSSTTTRGFMLFGVMITPPPPPPPPPEGSPPPPCISPPVSSPYMRKVVSMNNMSQYEQQPQDLSGNNHHDVANGYVSDDAIHASGSRSRERKRGIPWTEEEHKKFLLGLKKVGKGDWRGISRNYVKTRTPTQVASHAQKYFLRHVNVNRRRRRSSLFDITTEAVITSSPSIEDPSFNQGQTMTEFINPSMVQLPATSSKQNRNIPLIPLPPTSKMANLNLNQSPSSSSTSTHSSGEQHQPEQLLSLKLSPTTPTSDEESMSRASAFRGFNGNGDSIISVA